MKVRAKSEGFLGGKLYLRGEVFEVAGNPRATWYEPVDAEDAAEAKPAKRKAKDQTAVVSDGQVVLAEPVDPSNIA